MESGKVQITVAVIAMISGWGVALMTNWGDIFSSAQASESVIEQPAVPMIEASKYQELDSKLTQVQQALHDNQQSLTTSEQANQDLLKQIDDLKAPFHLLSNTKLKQILKFHNSAACYGRSLNLTHPAGDEYAHCQSKDALAKKLLMFFEELEIIEVDTANYSTKRAKEALVDLQSNYNFNNPGWYSEIMLGILIIEYAKKA